MLPYSVPPTMVSGNRLKQTLAEPTQVEVVVVVNNNIKMVHAGMFVAGRLLDPAGSYLAVRGDDKTWPGPTLADYVSFQLEDGDAVSIYRFSLADESLREIALRVEAASSTMPLFCAAKVQNILSGVPPFESVPMTWLTSPAGLASHLDRLIVSAASGDSGRSVATRLAVCVWADGSSCYLAPTQAGTSLSASLAASALSVVAE